MKSVIQKRILPVFLAVALLTSFMVFPVSAAGMEDTSGWYNVLDYTQVNTGSNTNRFGFTGSHTISLTLPNVSKLCYVDFLLRVNEPLYATVVRTSNKKFKLNCVDVGDGIYRYWGYINAVNYQTLDILFEGSQGVTYNCELLTCNVTNILRDSYADIGVLSYDIQGYDYISKKMSSINSPVNIRVENNNDPSTFYILNVSCPEWVKYDYIDFTFTLVAQSISSISACQGGTILDVDYTLIEGGVDEVTQSNKYLICLRLDLTGVNRSAVTIPEITIRGTKGIYLDATLSRVTGHIEVDPVNPLLYFFDHLENHISVCFATLYSRLDTYYSNLRSVLVDIRSAINTQFGKLKGWLEDGFQSVVDKLDLLVNGSEEQQAAADQFNDNVNTQTGQIDQAVNDMQVSRPDAGSIDTSVSGITGNLDFGLLNTCVQALVDSNTIYQLLIMAVTLMLVSYLLFGKKV